MLIDAQNANVADAGKPLFQTTSIWMSGQPIASPQTCNSQWRSVARCLKDQKRLCAGMGALAIFL
jgi:hypothetical protein